MLICAEPGVPGATMEERVVPDAQLNAADTAWLLTDSRYRNVLLQPYVVGYKKHPVYAPEFLYMDIEPTAARP